MTGTQFRASTGEQTSETVGTFAEAVALAERMAAGYEAGVHVEEFVGETDNLAYTDGWAPRRVVAEPTEAGPWARAAEPPVRISLAIENHYGGSTIHTSVTGVEVPPPPTLDEETDLWANWAYYCLFMFTGTGTGTGTGNPYGDAFYDVEITASSMPELVGRTVEWGY